MDDNTKIAATALRASVRFAAEVVSITEFPLPRRRLSMLNRTATVDNLARYVDEMRAFVELLQGATR